LELIGKQKILARVTKGIKMLTVLTSST